MRGALPLCPTPVSALSAASPPVSLELSRHHYAKMDSNQNSIDLLLPKIEIDDESNLRRDKVNWNSDNTMKLINMWEREGRELWDIKHPLKRDRVARQAKLEQLAEAFGTTAEEISRKTHNLRSQFSNELRKMKRWQSSTEMSGVSGWEYFDALSFLMRTPSGIGEYDSVDAVNLELAEFQANEEVEFGAAARANAAAKSGVETSPTTGSQGLGVKVKPALRVAASAPPPLPPSANPLMWPEEPLPKLRPSMNADDCQIFGDFVASELRTLRSHESRKKLKRMIQKAILQIGEEEDVNIISG